VTLRDVTESDLPILFAHQLDPEATRMAAFPAREWESFLTHWQTKVLGNPATCNRTIVSHGAVVGYISSWPDGERRFVGYWIGREHWHRGIATAALQEFLGHDLARPLHAIVAAHNVGSIRVLERGGFVRQDATMSEDGVEECLYRLDG
jgi:RimJ/RimL family protein N-acetyltransferase